MKNDDTNPLVEHGRSGDREADDVSLVERLLGAAGPGPEIPEDGAARIKDAIRPLWKEGASARARQRRLVWAGGLAAAAALVIAAVYLPSLRHIDPGPARQGITVALINGTLEVTPPGEQIGFFTPEQTGSEIPRGSLIRTQIGDRAALWLTEGRSLRLDVNTAMRLNSEASISLESGAVYIDSSNGRASGVEVRTPFGTATDLGTQFEVRLDDQTLDVKVREGIVALSRSDEEYRITQGVTLSVDVAGAVSTSSITPYDPAWGWTQEIAPPFEIEGRSALSFLDWISSETGLSIRFADPAVEQAAATTILHGTIKGLTPAEAPAVVLPSCRLAAIQEPGALLVKRLETE
jgi:hypothetical protein